MHTVGHIISDACEHGVGVARAAAPADETNEHPAVAVTHHQRATRVTLQSREKIDTRVGIVILCYH